MVPTRKKPDARVQRTRLMLLNALRTLLMERGYERLTIQSILERAGVGRATFYTHFESKDDLLAASVEGLRGWLTQEAMRRPPERLAVSLPLFEHFDGHRSVYRCTIGRRGEVTVGRMMRRMLRDLMRDDIAAAASPQNSAQVELTTEYVVGALWATVVWWMTTEPGLSPAEVNARFRRLVFSGIAS
jgi:AcrR family transcriptional regulator